MTTRAQIEEAMRRNQAHRFALLKLAKVDEAKARPGDLDLARELLASPNAAKFDEALARKEVNSLFVRGVIYYGSHDVKIDAGLGALSL